MCSSDLGLLHHEVPQEVWCRIKQLVAIKNPETAERLEQYVRAGEGVRIIKTSGERWSEADVEEKLVIPVLTELGWKVGETVVRQVEMDIKVGSGRPQRVRADFVGFRDAVTSEALFIIETKRAIRSAQQLQAAVEQAESYAGKLRCPRFGVAAPEGFWLYDLQFPGQSAQLATVELNVDTTRVDLGQLRPLIGFATLISSKDPP